jgi:hypothetical protein
MTELQDRTQCCPSYLLQVWAPSHKLNSIVVVIGFAWFLLQRSTGLLVQFSGINAAGDVSGFYRLTNCDHKRLVKRKKM